MIHTEKMRLVQPELNEINAKYKEKSKRGEMEGAKQQMNLRKNLLKNFDINMMAPLCNIIQLPIYISWFLGLRDIIYNPEQYHILGSEPFLWAPSIFVPDPYFIIPVLSAFTTYFNIKTAMKRAPLNPDTPLFMKKLKIYAPYLPFPGSIFLATMPAGINLYFLSLAFVNLITTIALHTNSFRVLAGIPKSFPGTVLHNQLISESKLSQVLKAEFVSNNGKNNVSEQVAAVAEAKPISNTSTVKVYSSNPKKKKSGSKEQHQNPK
jgi:hypothetical protein